MQTASLRHFGGGNEVQVVTFGPGYSQAATVRPLSLAINAAPNATSRGGAEEIGNTVTIATSAAHTLQVGDVVTIASVGVAGYNGTFTVTAVPTTRSFQYTAATTGLANSGGGTATYFAPFQVRIGGNDSEIIGGSGLPYSATNLQNAINAIPGFAGTVTASAATTTGFTVTYGGAAAGADVPTIELVNLSCGGCFASVEETNHGGAFDSFRLSYSGALSAPIVNGTNYSAAGIVAALTPILPSGATVTVTGFGGGAFNNTGFQATFGGALATNNVPVLLALADLSAGASGFVGETDKGGAVDNKGGFITPTGNTWPSVTPSPQYTIPLRTPFALTGGATDAEGDPLLYSWEQNDRGAAAGTSLLNNTKTDGPLFAMFPKSGQISEADTLLYNSPGENHLTTNPTRVFPDMGQILDNNTNAETGACPTGPIAPQAAFPVRECFAEFLPTSSYVGFAGTNASPLSLHFRLTVRDGKGGVNSGDTTLLLATGAGPFLVTSQGAPATYKGGSTQTISWNVANTNAAPVSAANVKISLSADGGATFPYVLAATTPNDGSEALALPNIATTTARIKIEAVDNIFFDISNANVTLEALPVVTNSLGGGSQSVQYSDALAPDLTIAASDADTSGASLSASASGLPAGLSLATVATSAGSALPGTRTWKLAGSTTAPAGSYPVSVTIGDGTGGTSTTTFTIAVAKEDAALTYTGDALVSPAKAGGSVTVKLSAVVAEAADGALGNTLGGKQVKFTIYKSGGATAGSVTATIDASTRIAAGTIALAADNYTVQLELLANSQYAAPIEDAVLTVADPGTGMVSGGGWVTEANGARGNLGFTIKYNASGKPQGNNLYISRLSADLSAYGAPAGVRSYNLIFKSNAMTAMTSKTTTTPKTATFSGRNTIKAVDRLTGQTYDISAGTAYSFQVDVTDRGDAAGTPDSYAMRVWSAGGVFKTVGSYSASGANTAQVNLGGGNLQIK